uniref:Enah/Vasp-like b n=1 Tax=Oncorhynchus tshawytscha TaxID=74940 RepID=A0AAZ3PTD9_ONCTS
LSRRTPTSTIKPTIQTIGNKYLLSFLPFSLSLPSFPPLLPGPVVPRQVQNGPTTDEMEVQRARQMMEQQQMQAHMERERRSSNPGSPFPGHPGMLSVAPPAPMPPPMSMGSSLGGGPPSLGAPMPPPLPGPLPPRQGLPRPPCLLRCQWVEGDKVRRLPPQRDLPP